MEIFEENDDVVEEEIFHVVKNHEEQYSIWPDYKDIPIGWEKDGFSGSKQDCLDHIDSVWKDIRPLSVRKHEEKMRMS